MTDPQNAPATLTRAFRPVPLSEKIIGTVLLLVVLVLPACGSSPTNTPTPTATSSAATPTSTTSAPQQTATSEPGATTTAFSPSSTATSQSGYPIQVYFSKFPDSLNNFNTVFPVNRLSPTIAVATFAIQLLIAGPTLSERGAGYFSEFNSILTGPSSCSAPYPTDGPDFTLTLNMKGSTPAQGTATLRLCRATSSPGIGADARILAEINATLKQFSNIKNVVILTQAGHCFADESGQDRCLK
jgi:hypothetical protein